MKNLKKEAISACIKIFKETPLKKIVYFSKNMRDAWEVGKELSKKTPKEENEKNIR